MQPKKQILHFFFVFWTVHFSIMKTKINQQNAQINMD